MTEKLHLTVAGTCLCFKILPASLRQCFPNACSIPQCSVQGTPKKRKSVILQLSDPVVKFLNTPTAGNLSVVVPDGDTEPRISLPLNSEKETTAYNTMVPALQIVSACNQESSHGPEHREELHDGLHAPRRDWRSSPSPSTTAENWTSTDTQITAKRTQTIHLHAHICKVGPAIAESLKQNPKEMQDDPTKGSPHGLPTCPAPLCWHMALPTWPKAQPHTDSSWELCLMEQCPTSERTS